MCWEMRGTPARFTLSLQESLGKQQNSPAVEGTVPLLWALTKPAHLAHTESQSQTGFSASRSCSTRRSSEFVFHRPAPIYQSSIWQLAAFLSQNCPRKASCEKYFTLPPWTTLCSRITEILLSVQLGSMPWKANTFSKGSKITPGANCCQLRIDDSTYWVTDFWWKNTILYI